VVDYLRERGVKYVVLPGLQDPKDKGSVRKLALDERHGANLLLRQTVCVSDEIAQLAFVSSETALQCQRLYAIDYVPVNNKREPPF
jgi:hypothetical protein